MSDSDRPHFDRSYWDEVWTEGRGAAMAATPPNPHLVRETSGLVPGTALEAGCGAGAEAMWLASRGWQVTAVDIAADPLELAARRAGERGVARKVTWLREDLSTWEPGALFDLVTTHYAHPEGPQVDFYERLAEWVAPGGTLFIVGHLHHGGNGHGHRYAHGHGDTPASVGVTAAAITGRLSPERWRIVTAAEAHREVPGHGGQPAGVNDVVVRATRDV